MATDYLTFTCTAPPHKAAAITAQLLDFTEPGDDWVTIYEVSPGDGIDSKDLGAGAELQYVMQLLLTAATESLQVANIKAWRTLKDGYGSIEYARGTYGPVTATTMRLISVDVRPINPLYAEATATFQKVTSNA